MGRNLSTDPSQTRWNEAVTVISRMFRQDRTENPAAAVYVRLVEQSRRELRPFGPVRAGQQEWQRCPGHQSRAMTQKLIERAPTKIRAH